MPNSFIPTSEIEQYRLNELIIKETAMQVIKDFATFGMEISFPPDLKYAYDILYKQLTERISWLMDSQPEKLSALLYQIDIDEQKLRALNNDAFIDHETISHMILEREFMKVLTRHYFSQKRVP